MSFLGDIAAGGLTGLLGGIGTLAKDIKQVLTGDASPEAKLALEGKVADLAIAAELAALEYDKQLVQSRADIIVAETKSESWLTRNWRPLLMVSFIGIIVNNYVIHPYISLFFPGNSVALEIPVDMWSVIKIGTGGYLVGRTGEKVIPQVVEMWKGK